ncbi:MAG: hypothetical protein O3A46_12395, partial [Candidatus Poribacteria bacterium]|nr:hypothetical protein [Candidatus Poribacteria bacterium]
IGWLWVIAALCVRSAVANVGMTPMRFDVYAQPGGSPEPFRLDLVNTSEMARDVTLSVEGFYLDERGEMLLETATREKRPEYAPIFDKYSAAPYIRFSESQMRMEPGEHKTITGEVTLPPSARGEYFALIVANPGLSRLESRTPSAHDIRISLRLSAPVFVIAGTKKPSDNEETSYIVERATPVRYSIQIDELRVEFPQKDDPRQTVKVVAAVDNSSNGHLFADLTALVRDATTNRVIERVDFSSHFRLMFPESKRVFVGDILSPLPKGTYQVRLQVDTGMGSARDTEVTQFGVLEPVVGLPGQMQGIGVLSVDNDRVSLAEAPGGTARHEIVLYNNVDERVRVETTLEESPDGGGVTLAPKQFVLAPGASRVVRVRVRVPEDAPSDVRDYQIHFTPYDTDGRPFDGGETKSVTLVVHVRPSDPTRLSPEPRESENAPQGAPLPPIPNTVSPK